jgi:hypothetical protein
MQRATIVKRTGPALTELESGLRIDVTDLNGANAQQAELYYRVAQRVAEAQAERDTAKLELEEAEADTASSLRAEAANSDEKKPTDKAIEAQVTVDASVMRAKRRLAAASAELAKIAALKDAYHQRGYALGNLSELQNHAHAIVENEAAKAELTERRHEYFRNRDATRAAEKLAEQTKQQPRRTT